MKTIKIVWAAFFLSLFLGCDKTALKVKTEVLDVNGVKSRIESVDKELSRDIKPQNTEQVVPARISNEVKVTAKTAEVFEFESFGEGVSTKYERLVDAEKRAEEEALSAGVKESGVNVYSGFQNVMRESSDSSYQFLGKYINVWSASLVSYEKVSPPLCSFDGTVNRCAVKIKGKVYFKGSPDPAFELKSALDKPAYFPGDEINLRLLVSKDSYITVLSCDEDGNVSVILPNNYASNRLFKAGEEITIPEKMGFKLRAYLPEGRPQSAEMLHIIAVKSQPLIPDSALKEKREGGFITYPLGGLKDLVTKLAKFDRQDWTSQVIIYEIKSR